MAREDAPRLRRRPRAAGRVGGRARAGPERARPPRRCAASRACSPSAGAAKSTVARKLAAIRTFYRELVERGELEANPADLVSSPKQDSYLPKVLKPAEVAALLERMPGSTPLELRDRAMFELAYSAGLRAEELVNLDVASADPDAEELRVEGKGGRPGSSRSGEPAWRALERLPRPAGGPALACRATARRCSSRRAAGGCPRPTCGGGCGSSAPRGVQAGSRRTRCGTRSPRTCWREAPTCARSRSCSDMRPSARPRPTLG